VEKATIIVTIQPGNAAILAASGAGRQDGGVPGGKTHA